MNSVYIRTKKEHKNIIIKYLLALIPLIIYGVYKNGYLLYQSKLISFIEIFRPLLFLLIPAIFIIGINYIKEKKLIFNYVDLKWIFISLFIFPSTNLILYSIIILIFIAIDILFKNKIKFNISIVFKLLLSITMLILNNYSVTNLAEQTHEYAFSVFDLLIGREAGGLFSSSLILAMIVYFIMQTTGYYKKNITIITMITYTVFILILSILSDITYINIGGIFLAIILIGSFSNYTPITFKGEIIYSVSLGILIVLIGLITNFYESVFISILLVQILYKIIVKFKGGNKNGKKIKR